jgi:phage-related protein
MMGSTGAIWLRTQTEKIDATYRLQQVHAQMMDKQAQATEMVQMIEKRYAGATVAYSKTMAGAWSNTVNGIELLAKSLSKILTPVLTVVFKGILAVVGALISMLNWAGKNKAVVIAAVAPILAYVAAMKALAFAAMLSKLRIGEWLTVQKASDIVNGASAAEVGILTAAQAAYVVGIEAATVAGEDLSIAQKGWIAVQALFNAVMDANPIMLVVIAVAALAAGIVYAYEHVAFFRNAAQAVFEWLKGAVSAVIGFVAKHWQLIVSILGGPFIALPLFVATHFALVLKFLEGIGHDIASVGSTIWDGLKDGFIDVINFIIKAFNAIPFIHGFHVGPVDVPGIPRIGLIAEGSSSTPASARGGAASVASPAARVLGREAAQARAESASGGMFAPPLVHVHTTFKLAGKDFARGAAIAQSQLKAAT